MLTFGSLFAGIGGFDLGFHRAGHRCLWQVEIDEAARGVLARHFPDTERFVDVRDVGAHNLAAVDIITFGSPCQDLSVAGRRAGLDGERSGLFFEAVRIIGELRPTYAVWENVPGALSSNGGRDFGAALDALADAGAVDIGWAVLDAQWFGVAQRRRRVFLVASFGGGASTAEILSLGEGGEWHPPAREEAGQGVAASLTRGSASGSGVNQPGRRREDDVNLIAHSLRAQGQLAHRADVDTLIPDIAACLTRREGKGPDSDATTTLIPFTNRAIEGDTFETLRAASHGALPMVAHSLTAEGHDASEDGTGRGTPLVPVAFAQNQRDEVRDLGGLAGESASQPGMKQQTFVAHSIAVRGRDDGQEWELGEAEVGNALRAGDGGSSRGNWALTPAVAVRRLTPTECERLQGFPDGWTAGQADSARYRQLGDAVCVNVSEWIAGRIGAA